MEHMPALEIGGTHVTAALVDARIGRVVAQSVRRRPLRAGGSAAQIVSDILRCARGLDVQAASWGVAIPGPFDYARGIGLFRGVAKFDALYGFDLGRALLDGLAPAAVRVAFLNDADAFMLGEWASGAASGHQRAVGITVGTGIGSAFLADGVIVDDGQDVPPEGSVHLLTIGGRPLEDTVSRRAILSRYTELARDPLDPEDDVREIAARAREGDRVASDALTTAFAALGEALAPWLVRFGATVLVVGGAIARAWDLLEPALRAGLERLDPDLPDKMQVRPALHPDEAALVGAAQHAVAGSISRTEGGGR
jgi:glucokinase